MLVTALPPPGTCGLSGRAAWEEEERAPGGCDGDCELTLSSSLSPIAGKPSPGVGELGGRVLTEMVGRNSAGTGRAATACGELGGGRWEELEAARLSRFRLDTYSSGSVPACFGLPRRQLGHSILRQFVH